MNNLNLIVIISILFIIITYFVSINFNQSKKNNQLRTLQIVHLESFNT